MCYIIALSSDSKENLSKLSDETIQFSQELPLALEQYPLAFENKWFVSTCESCSCGFRHLHTSAIELGFGEPVDWYQEELSEVEATKKFIEIVRNLIRNGNKVDCVDLWDHEKPLPPTEETLEVDLSKISDGQFRFFENQRFKFRDET